MMTASPNDKYAAFYRQLNLWALSITQDNELGKEATKVLFALYIHMNKDKWRAWPNLDTLAFETGMKRQNVQRGIRQAVERRHLKIEPQGTVYGDQGSNHYFMSFPEDDKGEAVEARRKKYIDEHNRRRTMINGHAQPQQPQPPQQQRSGGGGVTSRELPEDELPWPDTVSQGVLLGNRQRGYRER
jgi:hypothetical protein